MVQLFMDRVKGVLDLGEVYNPARLLSYIPTNMYLYLERVAVEPSTLMVSRQVR
jgi:hypothetical protein